MNRLLLYLLTLATAGAAVTSAPPPSPAKLRWVNGEVITGELGEATAAEVTWRSPIFEEPLRLTWTSVDRIDHALPAVEPQDPVAFSLRDGSHLYGEVIALGEETVKIRSARLGDATFKRSEVLNFRRLRPDGLVFAGPSGDSSWKPVVSPALSEFTGKVTAQPAIQPLVTGPGGALLFPYWNRAASMELELPSKVEATVRLGANQLPNFLLVLQATPKESLRLETWGPELVVARGDRFASLETLAETKRDVSFRVCWDRPAKKCSVFTLAGKLLAEWDVPEGEIKAAPPPVVVRGMGSEGGSDLADKPLPKPGLLLQNKGRDLSLQLLQVRVWNGEPPTTCDPTKPLVELVDGRILAGEIGPGAAGTVELRTTESEPMPPIPLASVSTVVFSMEVPGQSEAEATLAFSDGTRLLGRVLDIKNGRAEVQTAFSVAPLSVSLDGLRQMLVKALPAEGAPPLPKMEELDELVLPEATLHGRLLSDGGRQPHWMPYGGVAPTKPKSAFLKVSRALPADPARPEAPALFYTRMGDVLPGRLRALDREGVEIESAICTGTRLGPDLLQAIQFGAQSLGRLDGFNDPSWREKKSSRASLDRKNGTLNLEPETALFHPGLLQCSELSFDFENKGFSMMRLRLFASGLEPGPSFNLLMVHMGNRMAAGQESGDGQFMTNQQMSVPQAAVKVRLLIGDKQVELYFNDILFRKYTVDPTKRTGSGLVIEPASVWGNGIRPVVLRNFSARFVPGRTFLPFVNAEAKQQALTVPRIRKDDPPRHALLAQNGDLLRGEVEAITASHFSFRTGLETLRVPRDRVTCLIWLQPPDKGPPPAPKGNTAVQEALSRPMQIQTGYGNASLEMCLSLLSGQAAELKFKTPKGITKRARSISFGNESIGEALSKICQSFGLQYRVEADGTIVLSAADQTAKDSEDRVYWLKEAAFASDAAAREALLSKGVTFPEGSTLAWQPAARQLSMTNNAANQQKLAELLDRDFGGLAGGPTHWLQLTSGGRLGLEVERFDQEGIVGRHPVYGACRVPMNDVFVIDTALPALQPAAGALEEWRLAYAREPVIPEAGGESSPLIGKLAPAFKVPMLGGGDFDLAQEKGKVIVLDFWASWCGPCIKSLPGLMEAMSALPADRVKLLGLNQAEPAEHVKRFLETRGWKLPVGLDSSQAIGRQYGVEGIPHTVIIGPDGKVAWVKTGYDPEGAAEVTKAVQELLVPPTIPQ